MFDGSTMKGIRAAVSSYAASFDPAEISASVAQGVVEDAIAAENMLATVKALAAKRVADTELWKRKGDISPAHQLARKSGTSVARAKEALDTAAGLSKLPELEAAARSGQVSSAQAGAIADAAGKNPRAESRLMRVPRSPRCSSSSRSATTSRPPPSVIPMPAKPPSTARASCASAAPPTGPARSSTAPPSWKWPR
ncbi:MAG TPA: DUF222 domain-containing protein [Acidimicrobiales bacterium]|nr:DUF222 domain-containing protein [Acidimicrobiales bacterium]